MIVTLSICAPRISVMAQALAGSFAGEKPVQVIDARERMTVKGEQNVAGHETRARGRTVVHHFRNHHRVLAGTFEPAHESLVQRDGLPGQAQPRTPHATVAHETRGHVFRGLAADREADALRRARHRGVDADDEPPSVDERSARVAGVQRRVGLDHAFDQTARARA